MSTMYDPAKIRALAETGDKFYQGAWWILRQQEAAQLTGARASFMSDKISMDEAREKVWSECAPIFTREEFAARRRYRAQRQSTGA
ncbi:TPA: hypothetical protein OQU49_004300 [Shigella flexneri]|nr:hypothetical protein [Shigella flexneri]